jgi:hypothetical protein
MAVVVRQKFTDYTLDQYDQLTAKLGATPGGPHIDPGVLFHYIVATDEGVEITDIWTTREGFEKFSQEKLAPAVQELGLSMNNPPSVEFIEVHNYFTAG